MTFSNGIPALELGDVAWFKSRRSNSQGNCVQFAALPGGQIGVRDSKDPHGPALVLDRADAATWIGDLKSGRYDHLVRS